MPIEKKNPTSSKNRVKKTESSTKKNKKHPGNKTTAKADQKTRKIVHETTHEFKEGSLQNTKSKKRVTNPTQAIAIGLSEARKKGGRALPKNQSKHPKSINKITKQNKK